MYLSLSCIGSCWNFIFLSKSVGFFNSIFFKILNQDGQLTWTEQLIDCGLCGCFWMLCNVYSIDDVLSRTRGKNVRQTFYFQNIRTVSKSLCSQKQLKINSLETWPKSVTHITPDGLDIQKLSEMTLFKYMTALEA